MSYILIDQIDGVRVGEYEDKETAVQIVGGLMILHGIKMAEDRYTLAEQPDRKGMARVVYQPFEMFQRAIVYFDRNTYNKRKERYKK